MLHQLKGSTIFPKYSFFPSSTKKTLTSGRSKQKQVNLQGLSKCKKGSYSSSSSPRTRLEIFILKGLQEPFKHILAHISDFSLHLKSGRPFFPVPFLFIE